MNKRILSLKNILPMLILASASLSFNTSCVPAHASETKTAVQENKKSVKQAIKDNNKKSNETENKTENKIKAQDNTKTNNVAKEPSIKQSINQTIVAPDKITFMGYHKITNRSSKQYKQREKASLQKRLMCDKNGFYNILVDGEYYYCVAIGLGWGKKIGDKITIDVNGVKYRGIVADYKANRNTNDKPMEINGHIYPAHTVMTGGMDYDGKNHNADFSVVEFVVNTNIVNKNKNGYCYGNLRPFFPNSTKDVAAFQKGEMTVAKQTKQKQKNAKAKSARASLNSIKAGKTAHNILNHSQKDGPTLFNPSLFINLS